MTLRACPAPAADGTPASADGSLDGSWAQPIQAQARDLSLAGMYCYVTAPVPWSVGELVHCTVVVPSEQAATFPFARVLGPGWVVRVDQIPRGRRAGENPSSEERFGIAVAFASDVTALAAAQ
ncbi:MAG: hypothetical protein HYY15_04305 [Candidatus Omnitrophica bacterium]|nr:hypothetical protein [Candidatus Omnitrophota bacterium]